MPAIAYREYAQPLEVAQLARTALMSTAHFSRQFRAAYGETPYSYLPGCIARELTRPSPKPSRIREASGAVAA